LNNDLLAIVLSAQFYLIVLLSFIENGQPYKPPCLVSALHTIKIIARATKIAFARNQLYLRLISLSLLYKTHLSLLQQALVWSSRTN